MLILFLFLIFFADCNNNGCNDNKTDSLTANDKKKAASKEGLDSDTTVISFRNDEIQRRTFYLDNTPFFIPLDSNKIIATTNLDKSRIYIINPLTSKNDDSINVNKYWTTIGKKIPFQYSSEEINFLKNNNGEIKILLIGSGKWSNDKYIVSDLKHPTDKITYKGLRSVIAVTDINKVFSNNEWAFIDDSVYNISEVGNYNLVIKNQGQTIYSIIDSGEIRSIIFPGRKTYDHKIYRPASIFPTDGELCFFSSIDGVEDQSFLICENLQSNKIIKYVIPGMATEFWIIKNYIFFSLYNSDEKKYQYSYIFH